MNLYFVCIWTPSKLDRQSVHLPARWNAALHAEISHSVRICVLARAASPPNLTEKFGSHLPALCLPVRQRCAGAQTYRRKIPEEGAAAAAAAAPPAARPAAAAPLAATCSRSTREDVVVEEHYSRPRGTRGSPARTRSPVARRCIRAVTDAGALRRHRDFALGVVSECAAAAQERPGLHACRRRRGGGRGGGGLGGGGGVGSRVCVASSTTRTRNLTAWPTASSRCPSETASALVLYAVRAHFTHHRRKARHGRRRHQRQRADVHEVGVQPNSTSRPPVAAGSSRPQRQEAHVRAVAGREPDVDRREERAPARSVAQLDGLPEPRRQRLWRVDGARRRGGAGRRAATTAEAAAAVAVALAVAPAAAVAVARGRRRRRVRVLDGHRHEDENPRDRADRPRDAADREHHSGHRDARSPSMRATSEGASVLSALATPRANIVFKAPLLTLAAPRLGSYRQV